MVARVRNNLKVLHETWLDLNTLGIDELLDLSMSRRNEQTFELVDTVVRILKLFLANKLLKSLLDFLSSLAVLDISKNATIE